MLIGRTPSVEESLAEVLQFPKAPLVTGSSPGDSSPNYRWIGTGSQILRRLGVGKMKLLSAPVRFNALSGFSLEVTDFVQP